MIIFLSLKCFSVYFSMELFIGYLKHPIGKSGGLKWYEYVRNGGLLACVRVRTMGEGGQTFVILVRMYILIPNE